MKVILTKDIQKLGVMGDVKNVADGYARNYLIPRGYAIMYSPSNLKQFEARKEILKKKMERQQHRLEELKSQLDNITVSVQVEAAEDSDKIFGSVTNVQISEKLKEMGFDIDKKQIEIEGQIKELGRHIAHVKLGDGVEAMLKIWVERKQK